VGVKPPLLCLVVFVLGGLRKNKIGVNKTTLETDLEVKVRASGTTGTAGVPNGLPLVNILSADHVKAAQMGIQGMIAIAMVDHDHIAITTADTSRVDDHTAVGSIDWSPGASGNINTQVP
jgi:hypothetical protein